MGNILIPGSNINNLNSSDAFYPGPSTSTSTSSVFRKRLNSILLNRQDVINGRTVYINLLKYDCRVVSLSNNNYDLADNNPPSTNDPYHNTSIIDIRLPGVRNYLPIVNNNGNIVNTDTLIYQIDSFNIPILCPSDYTKPSDYSNYSGTCSVDMPEVCSKQIYDNKCLNFNVNGDSPNQFYWDYSKSRCSIVNDNIQPINPSTSNYMYDFTSMIVLSPQTIDYFDYMGRFMKDDSTGVIKQDILSPSNWNINSSYGLYIYSIFNKATFSSTTTQLGFPYLQSDFATAVSNAVSNNQSINTLYNTLLQYIIINNFVFDGGIFATVSINSKNLNNGEIACTCLNSVQGANLNIGPITGSNLGSNTNGSYPLINSNQTLLGVEDIINILNTPLDPRLKIAQNTLNYYYYDTNGNYIPPSILWPSSGSYSGPIYDDVGNQITPLSSLLDFTNSANPRYDAYIDVKSGYDRSLYLSNNPAPSPYTHTWNQYGYNDNYRETAGNSTIYSQYCNLGTNTIPVGTGGTLQYSPQYVVQADKNCATSLNPQLQSNSNAKYQYPYYINDSQPPTINITCTNNFNVYDNTAQTLNINSIIMNNVCGNTGNVNIQFNTYNSPDAQDSSSCFNGTLPSSQNRGFTQKSILVSGFNIDLNNEGNAFYSLFSSLNGTYITPPANSSNNFIQSLYIASVGGNKGSGIPTGSRNFTFPSGLGSSGVPMTTYIKPSNQTQSNAQDNEGLVYILFTPINTDYCINIYKINQGRSLLVMSSRPINYNQLTSSIVDTSEDFCIRMDYLSCELLFKTMVNTLITKYNLNCTYIDLISNLNNKYKNYVTLPSDESTNSNPSTTINSIYNNFILKYPSFGANNYIQTVVLYQGDTISQNPWAGTDFYNYYLLRSINGSKKPLSQYAWVVEQQYSDSTSTSPDSFNINNGSLVYSLTVNSNQPAASTTQFLVANDIVPIGLTYYIVCTNTGSSSDVSPINQSTLYYGSGPFYATEGTCLSPYMIADEFFTNITNSSSYMFPQKPTEPNNSIWEDLSSLAGKLRVIYCPSVYRYLMFIDGLFIGASNITNEQLTLNDLCDQIEMVHRSDKTNGTPNPNKPPPSNCTIISSSYLSQLPQTFLESMPESMNVFIPTNSNLQWQIINKDTFNKRLGLVYSDNVSILRFKIYNTATSTTNTYYLSNKVYGKSTPETNPQPTKNTNNTVTQFMYNLDTYINGEITDSNIESITVVLKNYTWYIIIKDNSSTTTWKSSSSPYDFDFKTNYINGTPEPTTPYNTNSYWVLESPSSYNIWFQDISAYCIELDLDPSYFSSFGSNLNSQLSTFTNLMDNFLSNYLDTPQSTPQSTQSTQSTTDVNLFYLQSNTWYQYQGTNTNGVTKVPTVSGIFYFYNFFLKDPTKLPLYKRTYGYFLNELVKDSLMQQNYNGLFYFNENRGPLMKISNVLTYYNMNDMNGISTNYFYDAATNLAPTSTNIYNIMAETTPQFFFEFSQLDMINNIKIDSFRLDLENDNNISISTLHDIIYNALISNPNFNINGPIEIIQIENFTSTSKNTTGKNTTGKNTTGRSTTGRSTSNYSTFIIYYSYINLYQSPIISADDNIGRLGDYVNIFDFTQFILGQKEPAISSTNSTPIGIFVNYLQQLLLNYCSSFKISVAYSQKVDNTDSPFTKSNMTASKVNSYTSYNIIVYDSSTTNQLNPKVLYNTTQIITTNCNNLIQFLKIEKNRMNNFITQYSNIQYPNPSVGTSATLSIQAYTNINVSINKYISLIISCINDSINTIIGCIQNTQILNIEIETNITDSTDLINYVNNFINQIQSIQNIDTIFKSLPGQYNNNFIYYNQFCNLLPFLSNYSFGNQSINIPIMQQLIQPIVSINGTVSPLVTLVNTITKESPDLPLILTQQLSNCGNSYQTCLSNISSINNYIKTNPPPNVKLSNTFYIILTILIVMIIIALLTYFLM